MNVIGHRNKQLFDSDFVMRRTMTNIFEANLKQNFQLAKLKVFRIGTV